jgi:hypothetical protein
VAKMAGACSLFAMSFLPAFLVGVVVGLVVVVVVVLVGVVRAVVAVAVVVGVLLVSALELVDLLVSAGQRMRSPVGPPVVVDNVVVASPGLGGVGRGFTSTLVVLLDVGGKYLNVPVTPDGSSMDAFDWSPSDNSIGLHASGWSKRSTVVGLLSVDVNARVLVLPEFGEGSSEAADLVVEVGFGGNDTVASLQLESDCHFHPCGIPVQLAVPYAALIGNV